jgi:antitoxin MazE
MDEWSFSAAVGIAVGFFFAKRTLHQCPGCIAYIDGVLMILQIARWGSSLALRIPADFTRHAGLKVGDQVQAHLTVDGGLSIRIVKWDRNAFAAELESMREAMPMTVSSAEVLRREARY